MAIRIAYTQPQGGSQGFARTKKVFGGPTVTLVGRRRRCSTPRPRLRRVPQRLRACRASARSLATATPAPRRLQMSLGGRRKSGDGLPRLSTTPTGRRHGDTLAAGAVGYEFLDDTDILLATTAAATGLGADADGSGSDGRLHQVTGVRIRTLGHSLR